MPHNSKAQREEVAQLRLEEYLFESNSLESLEKKGKKALKVKKHAGIKKSRSQILFQKSGGNRMQNY
jgi:hypothetical protein